MEEHLFVIGKRTLLLLSYHSIHMVQELMQKKYCVSNLPAKQMEKELEQVPLTNKCIG